MPDDSLGLPGSPSVHGIKFPGVLADSMHGLSVTLSLLGIAAIQIIAIIYPYATGLSNEAWWRWTASIECVEFTLIIALFLLPQVTIPLEVAYLLPLTSQVTTIVVSAYAIRRLAPGQAPRHKVIHSIGLGLAVVMISMTQLTLSVTKEYPNLAFFQGILYMTSSILGYHPTPSRGGSDAVELIRRNEL
ncbi:hypothetical protein B0T10DRAFT_467021 [Thelonectria olida]|uniref:Uncharacterized protein n=1 Tax=Thelonectria olida TaxID=1576542 RepID=A0A9P8VQR0_9HYPO|nr:hypothetical protein B0T10DRAFT_467021 [Thelonectria olida]